jgi:hypothetical protein
MKILFEYVRRAPSTIEEESVLCLNSRKSRGVVTVSQDSRPTRYNYNDSRKSRGLCGLSKLTQLTRVHLEQTLERSN